jgi:predicted phosphodiesterase
MMRIAIFSDIHGNLTALEAVLDDIKQQSPDMVAFAGDACLFGARPKECLDLIRDQDMVCVHGNTDLMVAGHALLSDDIKAEINERQRTVESLKEWTAVQLTAHDRNWLEGLPFLRRISPTTNLHHDLLIVHANPQDVDQPIYPSADQQQQMWGEVRQPDADLLPLMQETVAGVMAFGHYHVPSLRLWQDMLLANISSVSLPLDGDRRAKYGLLTWTAGGPNQGEWQVEHRRVEYDVEQALQALAERQPPGWQELQKRLVP